MYANVIMIGVVQVPLNSSAFGLERVRFGMILEFGVGTKTGHVFVREPK